MSAFILDFIKTSAIPALGVAIFFFLIGGRKDPLRARLQALAFAVAFVCGNFLMLGNLNFPPHDVNQAFSWAALALALFVFLAPRSVGARYLVRAGLVIFLGALCFWQIRGSLQGPAQLRNLLAFFFLGLGTWSILEKSATKVQPLTMVILPVISATALSILVMIKGSAVMAQQLGILCSLLGGVSVILLIAPKKVSAAALLPFVSIFVILFMAAGHFLLDVNPWFMVYLCFPFLILWIRDYIPLVPRAALPEAAILGGIAVIPLAYFIWTVLQASGAFN